MEFNAVRVRGMYILKHPKHPQFAVSVMSKDEKTQDIRVRVMGAVDVIECRAEHLHPTFSTKSIHGRVGDL